jgi:hypothetical protein
MQTTQSVRRILFFIFLSVSLQAGTVRLFNNSNFDLRAVVRGSDGSYLGEMVVKAQTVSSWSDSYIYAGGYRGPIRQYQSYTRTRTPYVVQWYCMDGKDFAYCDTTSTGALVMALNCTGARTCTPKKKSINPNMPESLQPQPQE